LFFLSGDVLLAQFPTLRPDLMSPNGPMPSRTDDTASRSRDSLKSNKPLKPRFHPWNITAQNAWNKTDTLNPSDTTFQPIQLYTQWLRNTRPWAYTGVSGSPETPLFIDAFGLSQSPGIRIGANPYLNQTKSPLNFSFHKVGQPYTEFLYTQGDGRYNGLEVLHTQNFSPTWNVTLDYRSQLINQDLHVGARQQTMHRNIALGSNFQSQNKRFDQQTIFSWNRTRREENGGLKADSLFYGPSGFQGSQWDIRTFGAYTPWLNQANSFWANSHHRSISRYHLKNDSFKHLAFIHQLDYQNTRFHYTDKSVDTTFYQAIPIIHNTKNIYDSTVWKLIENRIGLEFRDQFQTLGFSFLAQNAIVRYQSLTEIPSNLQKQNFQSQGIELTHKIHANRLSSLSKYTYLFNGFGKGYLLTSNLNYSLSDSSKISFQLFASDQPISLFQYQYLGNFVRYKINQPFNEQQWSVQTAYTQKIKKIRILASAQFGSKNHFLNIDLRPTNIPSIFYQQINLQTQYQSKHWFTYVNAFWQNYADSGSSAFGLTNLGLPKWNLSAGVAFQQNLFKKALFLRYGFDIRYISSYSALYYRPDALQFYFNSQNLTKIGNYATADIYISGRVQTVDFFLKMEHLNEWLISPWLNPHYEWVKNYPIEPSRFRMGISWKFWN
jgi:hypothetical protein